MTIIDSLVVKLGLDAKDMKKEVPAVNQGLKSIEKQSDQTTVAVKDTSKGLGDLASSAGKLLAVIGGTVALKNWITGFIEANGALKRLSDNLGVSVPTISAWSQAAEQLGGSAAGLQGTFTMLSKAQTQLRLTGESSLVPYFSQLGVSMATLDGKARPVEDILLNLADRFATLDRPTANNLGQMMGIDQGTMNLLLQGRTELELTIKRQKESTAVTKAQAEQAYKLEIQTTKLKQGFESLGRTLLEAALPYLEKAVDWLIKLGAWIGENSDTVKTFLTVLAAGLGAIGIAALPIEATVVAIVGLAAAIALLWNDYKVWKAGGDSLIDWGRWEPGITAATKGIEWLGKAAKVALETVGSLAAITRDLFKGDTAGATRENDSLRDRLRGKLGLAPLSASPTVPTGGTSNVPTLAHAIERMEGEFAKGDTPNRPQRNFNPGNIEYGDYAKAHGATGSDGRFAIFPDYATGHQALVDLLQGPKYAGLTVAQAISKYAPPKENNTKGYIASVTKGTGLNADSIVGGVSGASGAAQVGGTTPAANDYSRYLHVGEIKVYTQAKDADGIAADMKDSLDYLFTSHAQTGLQQ